MGFIRLPAYWDQINEHLDGLFPDEAIRLLADRDRELEDAVSGLTFFQLSDFTAIVDSAFTASNPSQGQFRGIGEALNYYYALSTTTHIKLGVMFRNTTYTETASINWPYRVEIVGLAPGNGDSTSVPIDNWSFSSGGYLPCWDLGGFNATASPNTVWISKMAVRSSNHAAGSTTLIPSSAATYARDCAFWRADTPGAAPIISAASGSIYAQRCQFRSVWACATGSGDVLADDCIFDFTNNTAIVLGATLANNHVHLNDCYVSWGDNNPTVSISHSRFTCEGGKFGKNHISSTSTTLTALTLTVSSAWFRLQGTAFRSSAISGMASDHINLILNTSNFDVDINNGGYFQVSAAGATRNNHRHIKGAWTNWSNTATNGCIFRGPGNLDITLDRYNGTVTKTLTLSGEGIIANVAIGLYNGTATSLEVSGENVDNSIINVAFSNVGATVFVAGHKPFAFDAASGKNICHFAGASILPTAGTDAGAANNIVQT